MAGVSRAKGNQMRKSTTLLCATLAMVSFAPAMLATNVVVPPSGLTRRSLPAILYPVSGGATAIDLKSTGLLNEIEGHGRVLARPGVATIEIDIRGLIFPTRIGPELLTYVLWAVSTQGRAVNLGGIRISGDGHSRLKAEAPFAGFSLFVTAEPYSAVRWPSEMLVLENAVRRGTKARIQAIDNYQLIRCNQYERPDGPKTGSMDLKHVPIELYEARNAVDLASSRHAGQYAPGLLSKAERSLRLAEKGLDHKANRNDVVNSARRAVEFAEDARALAVERQVQERMQAGQVSGEAQPAPPLAGANASAGAAESRGKPDKGRHR